MATVTLKGADAKAFVEAWREFRFYVNPEICVCTRCQAQPGQRCRSLTTGKAMKTYHAERVKLERRVRALNILRTHGPMTAGDFAARFWPDCKSRDVARNAATFLFTLWREGLVVSRQEHGGRRHYEAKRP